VQISERKIYRTEMANISLRRAQKLTHAAHNHLQPPNSKTGLTLCALPKDVKGANIFQQQLQQAARKAQKIRR